MATPSPQLPRGDPVKENALRELYVNELKDLYSAENQLIKALPKMAQAATAPKLKAGFKKHLGQTKEHVRRLERIFKSMEEGPHGKHCNGMEGLIKEGSEAISEDPGDEELDAALIAAAQHVEHYEMAGYGCVRTWARLLGERDAAKLLEKTFKEEKQIDLDLTVLSKKINVVAEKTEVE
jgi:ferritin-like metal-binding protein YciE